MDKLTTLDDNYTSILSGDWEVQYIEDAFGPIVNMDYFPVTITELPKDPSTGQTFTPESFFNFVRTNLDDFFVDNSTTFGPYNEAEDVIWNSNDYLGAIMRFEISPELLGIEFSQDGSVICSNLEDKSWIFTTIESPMDWNHPVSGNRAFVLNKNPDGSYTFFTQGVDRVAEINDDLMGNLPLNQTAFEGADALWGVFQDNIASFVNNPLNGGQAEKGTAIISRPNWTEVRDVLNGDKSISSLGCN